MKTLKIDRGGCKILSDVGILSSVTDRLARDMSWREASAPWNDMLTSEEKKELAGAIKNLAGRLEVAKRLDNGESQRKVSADTGVSIAIVTRVNRFLKRGKGGYRLVLDRLKKSKQTDSNTSNHSHT